MEFITGLGHFECPQLAAIHRFTKDQREELLSRLQKNEAEPETKIVVLKRNAVAHLKGVLTYLQGRTKEAVEIFEDILKSDSENINALLNLAHIYGDQCQDKQKDILHCLKVVGETSDKAKEAMCLCCQARAVFELNVACCYLCQGVFSVDLGLESYRQAISIGKKAQLQDLSQWTFELAYCCYLFIIVKDLIQFEFPENKEREYFKESVQLFHDVREDNCVGALSWLFLGILINRRQNWTKLISNSVVAKELKNAQRCFRKAARLASGLEVESIEAIIELEENPECDDSSRIPSSSSSPSLLSSDVVTDAAPSYDEYQHAKVKDMAMQDTHQPVFSETPDQEADELNRDVQNADRQEDIPSTSEDLGVPVQPNDTDSGIVVATSISSLQNQSDHTFLQEQSSYLSGMGGSDEQDAVPLERQTDTEKESNPPETVSSLETRQESGTPSQSSSYTDYEKDAVPSLVDDMQCITMDSLSLEDVELSPKELYSLSKPVEYYDAFILGSKLDKDKVNDLTELLEGWDRKVLLQEDFTGGKSVFRNVADALNYSSFVVVVLTENFLQDKWCEKNIHTSLVESLDDPEKHDYVVPVAFGVEEKQMPSELKSLSCLRPSNRYYKKQLQKTVATDKRAAREYEQQERRDAEKEMLKRAKREKLLAKEERRKKDQRLARGVENIGGTAVQPISDDDKLRKQYAADAKRKTLEEEKALRQFRKHERQEYSKRDVKEEERLLQLKKELEAKEQRLKQLEKMQRSKVNEEMPGQARQPMMKGVSKKGTSRCINKEEHDLEHGNQQQELKGGQALVHNQNRQSAESQNQPIIQHYYITGANVVQIGQGNVVRGLHQQQQQYQRHEGGDDSVPEIEFVPSPSATGSNEATGPSTNSPTPSRVNPEGSLPETSPKSPRSLRSVQHDGSPSGAGTRSGATYHDELYQAPPDLESGDVEYEPGEGETKVMKLYTKTDPGEEKGAGTKDKFKEKKTEVQVSKREDAQKQQRSNRLPGEVVTDSTGRRSPQVVRSSRSSPALVTDEKKRKDCNKKTSKECTIQ